MINFVGKGVYGSVGRYYYFFLFSSKIGTQPSIL